MNEHHAFLTGLSEDVVATASHKVEDSYLTEGYSLLFDREGTHLKEPRIRPTKSTSPALRSLGMDRPFLGDSYDSRLYALCWGSPLPGLEQRDVGSNLQRLVRLG
jgi:hypothetical protein